MSINLCNRCELPLTERETKGAALHNGLCERCYSHSVFR